MYYRLLFLFFLINFSSCGRCGINQSNEPVYVRYVDQITRDVCLTTGKADNLTLVSQGGSYMCDVKEVDLHFNSEQHVNVDQAREIYVRNMSNIMNRINSDKDIRPYLHEYPFTEKSISLAITFEASPSEPKEVGLVSIFNGIISYKGSADISYFGNIHKESYQDAVRIVNEKT